MRMFPKTLLTGLLTLAVLGSNLVLPIGAEAAGPRTGGNTAELKKIEHEELVAAKKMKKKHHHKKHHHKKHHHKKHHHKKIKAASVRQLEQRLDNLLERDLGKKS
jgi:hypothetical protein